MNVNAWEIVLQCSGMTQAAAATDGDSDLLID